MEQTHLGLVLGGTGYSATTSTITQTDSTVTGFYNQQRIPRGCPILITAGAGANENTASNLYSPLAGTITVSPSITTASTGAVLAYYDSGIDHFDRVKEAINRYNAFTRLIAPSPMETQMRAEMRRLTRPAPLENPYRSRTLSAF